VLYPLETGRLGYTPRHWVPFSSLPMARKITEEVFEPRLHTGKDCRRTSYFYFRIPTAIWRTCKKARKILIGRGLGRNSNQEIIQIQIGNTYTSLPCWMWPLEATIKKTKENKKGIIIEMKRNSKRE
jgi:hypothetical protein